MGKRRTDPLAAAMRTIGRPLALAAQRTSTTAQGYGVEHQRQRTHLLAITPEGWPCPLCLQPMHPKTDPRSLDADHSIPTSLGGTLADRLTHASCNRSRGNGTRPRRTPAPGAQAQAPQTRAERGGQAEPASHRTREW